MDCRQDHSESRQRLINQPSRLIIQAVEFSRWYHHIQPTNRFRLTTSHIEPIHASEKIEQHYVYARYHQRYGAIFHPLHFKAWESGNPGNLWLSLQSLHFPAGGWLNIQLGWLFSKKLVLTDNDWWLVWKSDSNKMAKNICSWLRTDVFLIVFCSPTLWFWNLLVI